MGLEADIIQGLEQYEITRIGGQPTEEDLTQLILELSNALDSVATTLGGGEHGHVGMIIDEAEYTFSRNGEKFVAPKNPGAYPKTSMPMQSSASNKLPSTKQSKTNLQRIKLLKHLHEKLLLMQLKKNG
jgi:hypothetical protein